MLLICKSVSLCIKCYCRCHDPPDIGDHVLLYSNIRANMPLNLLVRPHDVMIPVLIMRGVRLTRLLAGPGVNVTEVVTGIEST